MADLPIIVVDKRMDERWGAQAQVILAHGAAEGWFHFSPSLLVMGEPHALFAFTGEESDAEDAVGVATYAMFQTNEYHRIFRLNKLSVLPEQRREGVAQAILSRAYELAVERGCTEVDALISTFNFPMLRLAQKAGFRKQVIHMRMYVDENKPAGDWDF